MRISSLTSMCSCSFQVTEMLGQITWLRWDDCHATSFEQYLWHKKEAWDNLKSVKHWCTRRGWLQYTWFPMSFHTWFDGNSASQIFSPPTNSISISLLFLCRGGKQQHCHQRNQLVIGYQLIQEHHSIRDFMLLELVLLWSFLLNFIFKVGGILLDTCVAWSCF